MKLFVAGLPADFDEVDLREMFELYGDISAVKLIKDRVTNKSKGFGFVEMPNEEEARETIKILNGAGMGRGKKMSVQEANEAGGSGSRPAYPSAPKRNYSSGSGDGYKGRSDGDRFNR